MVECWLKNNTLRETTAIKNAKVPLSPHMRGLLGKLACPGAPIQYFILEDSRNP
jgi:hypothetical protein